MVELIKGQLYCFCPGIQDISMVDLSVRSVLHSFRTNGIVMYLDSEKKIFDEKGREVELTLAKVIYQDQVGYLMLSGDETRYFTKLTEDAPCWQVILT